MSASGVCFGFSGMRVFPSTGNAVWSAGDEGATFSLFTFNPERGNLYIAEAIQQQHSNFSPEVDALAWKLLEEAMTPGQYVAFMEGDLIEKESACKRFRLLIEKAGKFSILEGSRGEGIVAAKGNVRSGKYPLGDEIYTFVAWFEKKPEDLIAAWNCGNYSIKDRGERR